MTTRNDTNDQVNKAAEKGKNAADEAARTARTVTDEAAKVGEQTARASADLARQGAETAQEEPAGRPGHGGPDLPAGSSRAVSAPWRAKSALARAVCSPTLAASSVTVRAVRAASSAAFLPASAALFT